MKSKELGQISEKNIELISVLILPFSRLYPGRKKKKFQISLIIFDKVDNRNRWSLNVPILMMIISEPDNLLSKSLTVGQINGKMIQIFTAESLPSLV